MDFLFHVLRKMESAHISAASAGDDRRCEPVGGCFMKKILRYLPIYTVAAGLGCALLRQSICQVVLLSVYID